MSKHLQRDLDKVQAEVLAMSGIVEEMIDNAARALCSGDRDRAAEVISHDEVVDRQEVHIEEECLKMLALHQPVAIDLRRIAALLKINNDLERMADLAVNVAERALSIADHPDFPVPDRLRRMVQLATTMVRGALDAFVNLDPRAARRICLLDDDVDRYNVEIIAELHEAMRADPDLISPAMYCFSASRHIERIADHATNIAEDVVYLVEGDIVRHQHSHETRPV